METGKAYILNINDRGKLLLEYLKSKGCIESITFEGTKIWFEFKGEVTITFNDYLEVHPRKTKVERFKGTMIEKLEKETFNRYVQIPIIKSIQGDVVNYIPGEEIRIKDAEKTEFLSIRVTREEKEQLEKMAQELGTSISDIIRTLLNEKIIKH